MDIRQSLIVVIRFSAGDSAGTVYLFDKKQPDELMRECHIGKGEHSVGTVVYGLGEAVWASDYEYERAGQLYGFARDEIGELT